MKSNYELWADSFDLSKVQLWNLEECCTKLLVSKDVIHSGRGGNEDMLGRMPVYHVWKGDKEVYCGQSMSEAYSAYRKILNDAMNRAAT